MLDIGRSVDYYDRLNHSAAIVLMADLDGFTHREIALSGRDYFAKPTNASRTSSQYAPLLTIDDCQRSRAVGSF